MPEQQFLFKNSPLVKERRTQPFFLCKGALTEKLDQNEVQCLKTAKQKE